MPEILRTHQLSAAIIDLIEGADEYCYLVSPYFKPWPLLDRAFSAARRKGKRVTLIVRSDASNLEAMIRRAKKFEAELIALDRLHTKLYLNESTAITSSMNLYDSSSEFNFELGILWRERYFVRELKTSIVDEELVAADRRQWVPGWFTATEAAEAEAMTRFREQLATRGFCVTCGDRMEFDSKPSVVSGRIVRCRPCWQDLPFPEEQWSFGIAYCHYCGDENDSVLVRPFHHDCLEELRAFQRWMDGAAGKYQQSAG